VRSRLPSFSRNRVPRRKDVEQKGRRTEREGDIDENSTTLTARDLKLKSTLLLQHERELERRGEGVKIMCVGESGVGKSSLIANIFTVPVARSLSPSPTTEIRDTEFRMESDGIPLKVTFVDTPGYGDTVELGQTFKAIATDLDRRMKTALEKEEKVDRADLAARRLELGVDAVLYFIAPHRLKGIDIEFLRVIQGKASIIPILAKADTMTSDELAHFRALVVDR
jgi:septin 7